MSMSVIESSANVQRRALNHNARSARTGGSALILLWSHQSSERFSRAPSAPACTEHNRDERWMASIEKRIERRGDRIATAAYRAHITTLRRETRGRRLPEHSDSAPAPDADRAPRGERVRASRHVKHSSHLLERYNTILWRGRSTRARRTRCCRCRGARARRDARSTRAASSGDSRAAPAFAICSVCTRAD